MLFKELKNGVKVPMIGFGVYQIPLEDTKRCVLDAIKAGYRHIDTAQSYFNEEGVGDAIVECGLPREELFITSKVWLEHYGYEATKESVLESLRKLKTEYIDLMLLHQPFNDVYGSYRALIDLYKDGKIKAIGVSNFSPDRLVDIASFNEIPPMVNQVETNPFNQQTEAQKWNEKYGCALEAWAPFGEGRKDIFTNETLKSIGDKYGKSNAQVIVRWLLQRGVIVLAKSVHFERMQQNIDVFDFELTDEDMKLIASLDDTNSLFFSHTDPNMVEWFVKMVQERKKNKVASKEKKNW
jgi:2,5-diketo-D-gluconate reductase A